MAEDLRELSREGATADEGERMSEQAEYERVSPGQRIKATLSAVHAQERMGSCSVEFRHESGSPSMRVEGELVPTGRRFSHPSGVAGPVSEAKIEIEIPPGTNPGVYRVSRMWAESFGGTPFEFAGGELHTAADIGFEVLAEPDTKPALEIRVTRVS